MQPISPISINVITHLPKIHIKQKNVYNTEKNINPANQPALSPHKRIEYEQSPKAYLIPGCNNHFFQEYMVKSFCVLNIACLYFVIADKYRQVFKTIKHTIKNNIKEVYIRICI